MIFQGRNGISDKVKLKIEEIERGHLLEPEEERVQEIMESEGLERVKAEEKAMEEKFSEDSIQKLEDAVEPKGFVSFEVVDGKVFANVDIKDAGRHNQKIFDVKKELPFVHKPTYQEKQKYAALNTDSERIDFLARKLGLVK